jgi:outer membrane immunogenic protein
MRKLLLAGFAVAALVATGSAHAADLGPRPAYKAPPPVAVPVPWTWTGFYVGAHGGGAWGKLDTVDVLLAQAGGSFATQSIHPQGYFAGGQIGFNYQFANTWVVGIEADAAGSRIDTQGALPVLTSIVDDYVANLESFGTVRGRLGFGWGHWLLYGTGGWAWGHVRANLTFPFTDVVTQNHSGWTAGAGIEYAIAPTWTIKAEYLFLDLGTRTYTFATSFPTLPTTANLTVNTFKVGVNYKFDWGKGKAPVVARY